MIPDQTGAQSDFNLPLIYSLMYYLLFVGVLCLSLFWCALLCVLSSFAIILKRKRELVALLLLPYRCHVTVNVLWPFLAVPWVGLKCVIVVFPDHTHLLFHSVYNNSLLSEVQKSLSTSKKESEYDQEILQ